MQGEGIYLGERQLFVRFFGCNLSCRYCDTKLHRFMEYEPSELFEEIKLYQEGLHSVSFTGGEPLLQAEFLAEIMQLTNKGGFKNYLETNGTLVGELEKVIDYVDIVAMDIKLPGSTGMGHFWGLHRKFLKISSRKEIFVKMVVCNSTSYEDLIRALILVKEINPAATLVLQPNSYEKSAALDNKIEDFSNICRDNDMTACIIPQMHKSIGIK